MFASLRPICAILAAFGVMSFGIASAAGADAMTLSFSWANIHGCTEQEKSPAFQVLHAPPDTRFLIFALTDPSGRQARGQYVNYPPDGVIQPGAVSFMPPCKPGRYLWTITATDRAGNLLATARDEETFAPKTADGVAATD